MIYIIEAENGLCKIGHSANPEGRANIIHMHSPVAVRLIAKWDGGRPDEQKLHDTYAQYRTHREWFRSEGWLAEFIEQVRGRNVVVTPWPDVKYWSPDEQRSNTTRKLSESARAMWARKTAKERAAHGASVSRGRRASRKEHQ